jgi:hypothetical protein
VSDVTVSRTFTERMSMSIGVPFVAASWGIPSVTASAPGPRANEDAHGLGDISVSGRYWLLPTTKFTTGNISAGVGVKMPTGNEGYMDTYPDRKLRTRSRCAGQTSRGVSGRSSEDSPSIDRTKRLSSDSP